MPKKNSILDDIVSEISVEININKKDVRNALKWTFRQISTILVLWRKPVMIRGYIKFVLAKKGIKKVIEEYDKYKTKSK
jgi:nucleoid DNA-binding protein